VRRHLELETYRRRRYGAPASCLPLPETNVRLVRHDENEPQHLRHGAHSEEDETAVEHPALCGALPILSA